MGREKEKQGLTPPSKYDKKNRMKKIGKGEIYRVEREPREGVFF
jgi:hypothetical protein